MTTVGIIGGYGRFGSKLAARLEQLCSQKLRVIRSEERGRNYDIARQSDILVLAVPTEQAMPVLEEVRDVLNPKTEVVSFASGVLLGYLNGTVPNPTARAMMNQGGTLGMWLPSQGRGPLRFGVIMDEILSYPLFIAKDDYEIDQFTVSLVYLFVVGLWAATHRDIKPQWLEQHLIFGADKLGINRALALDLVQTATSDRGLRKQLEEKAARGGITAAMVNLLREDPNISSDRLHNWGWSRMLQYATSIAFRHIAETMES